VTYSFIYSFIPWFISDHRTLTQSTCIKRPKNC